MELSVVPTTAGLLLVGCTAPAAWTASMTGCAAGVLRIAGAGAAAPSPELAARWALPGALARLNAARRAGRAALHAARAPHGQARAARRIARAHRAARARLEPLLPPRSRDAIVALRRSTSAYDDLARAAAAADPGRYASAGARARRADAALRRALATLAADA
jgi:hypothetical protein